MAEVNLTIDGRVYGIACDDGQERRVQQLGGYIDQRLREISHGSGANNKSQLMVLTALLLADEVFDLRANLTDVSNQNQQLQQQAPAGGAANTVVYEGLTPEDEHYLTGAIGKLAARVEKLTTRVQRAG
jgi:cell division protein ZapA